MSKIVKLEAENVKRLRAVSITPDGAVVRIGGFNGQGKTSVLDSIEYALAGEKSHPAEPIRRGAEKARVLLETDDGIVVERRWTAGGTRLEVRNRDGLKFSSPQKLLDGLVGRLSFDPLQFMRERPERQAEILRELIGVDFSGLDAKRRQVFDARTEVNRRVAASKARLAAIPESDAPDELASAATFMEEQRRRTELAAANDRKRVDLGRIREDHRRASEKVAAAQALIGTIEAELARAKESLVAAMRAQGDLLNAGVEARKQVEAIVDPDLDEIPRQVRELEAVNDRVRQKKARTTEQAQLAEAEAEAARLTAALEEIDARKAAALEAAALPVPGLAFGEGGVTLDDIPLEQASSAEQLRVSVAMGLTLNPKLKVLLIRDGSLLDERSLGLVAQLAEKAGAQVWLEVVGKGGVGIVIEDGQVEGAATVPAHAS